jgi:uncharacterized membrane protein YeiH
MPMTDLLNGLYLAGTFVFAISGATIAVQNRLDIFGVMVLAFITASAGGVIRGHKPLVLSSGFYASAAIAAIALVLVARALHLPGGGEVAIAAVALCFALRVLAIYGQWNLPSTPIG